ncbi:MAG TPA: NAD(P)H-hydrate dehydratase [Xanthomonadales bacterium]|nr:NAD(P)H-hydrate dehydratase [Xanthomonadales bacterium]
MPKPAGTLCTVAGIREIDRRAIAAIDGDPHTLMVRAAEAAFRRLRARWPEARRLAVLCGSGNNGGDGYVLARLARAAGLDAQVIRPGADAMRTEEARRARDEFLQAGGRESMADAGALAAADVVVDALLGVGLTRAPDPAHAALIDAANAASAPVIALDLPSGLDADTGAAPGACIVADATVAFIALKRGHVTGSGCDACGALALESLGVARGLVDEVATGAMLIGDDALRRALPRRARGAHKGDFGHVLVVGGERGYGGAARLAAEAALRSGAGLASLATRAEHVAPVLAARPEIMVRAVETPRELAPLAERASVIAVGPGLGRAEWGRALLHACLDADRALVLDADALNLLAEAPRFLPAGTILTPHPGEAGRLLGTDARAVQRDRYGAACAIARLLRCVVVLKGAGTIVADGERFVVGPGGNPALATGGSGDVLTGIIAALRAQGHDPFDAAMLGVAAHAAAAQRVARAGERGAVAGDLVAELPRVLNP